MQYLRKNVYLYTAICYCIKIHTGTQKYPGTHRYTLKPTVVTFTCTACRLAKLPNGLAFYSLRGGANCRLPNGLLKCQTFFKHGFCNVCTVVVTHRYILGTSGYTKVHFGTFRWVHYQTRISRQALVHTGTYMYMHVTSGAWRYTMVHLGTSRYTQVHSGT